LKTTATLTANGRYIISIRTLWK